MDFLLVFLTLIVFGKPGQQVKSYVNAGK